MAAGKIHSRQDLSTTTMMSTGTFAKEERVACHAKKCIVAYVEVEGGDADRADDVGGGDR